ncbi:MAG: transcription termination/antitermination protein NusG [Anaerolineales bacterium]|jgi:transcriptional antiterminator NusG
MFTLDEEKSVDMPEEESPADEEKAVDESAAESADEPSTDESSIEEASTEDGEAQEEVSDKEPSANKSSIDDDTVETQTGEVEATEDEGSTAPVDEPSDDEPILEENETDHKEEAAEEVSEEGSTSISVEEEADDGRAWYVVHCYSGYENKVRHNLEQRIETMGMKNEIFDVVVPTEEEIEVKDGKRKTVERRVFPGYILVNMLMSEESWYVVRNTPGVTSFVGMGNEPVPLRPEEVSQIIKRMEADAPRIKVSFRQGERVRIIDGPFNDFRGTVDDIDMDRAKVRVMVNFFGRETPVELDFLQVEKA